MTSEFSNEVEDIDRPVNLNDAAKVISVLNEKITKGDLSLVRDHAGRPACCFESDGSCSTLGLRTEAVRGWVAYQFLHAIGRTATRSEIIQILDVLSGIAVAPTLHRPEEAHPETFHGTPVLGVLIDYVHSQGTTVVEFAEPLWRSVKTFANGTLTRPLAEEFLRQLSKSCDSSRRQPI
jgi:hypothetical protein